MAKWLKIYATYTFFTSPHSCYRTTLLNTKVPNFRVSQENKIAETLCLVLKVCPTPWTQALRRRRHWPRWQHPRSTGQRVPLVVHTHFKFV